MTARRAPCRHAKTEENRASKGQCKRCDRLVWNRRHALRNDLPLCAAGHGLVYNGVAPNGSCTECTPPPPDDWLDWAAVYRAIEGAPLPRPLTRYETVCAIVTVCRRNQWGKDVAVGWLRANTGIAMPDDDAAWLLLRWAPRQGLPLLTVAQAITYENPPDTRQLELEDPADSPQDEDAA